jgi:hypothetical protein
MTNHEIDLEAQRLATIEINPSNFHAWLARAQEIKDQLKQEPNESYGHRGETRLAELKQQHVDREEIKEQIISEIVIRLKAYISLNDDRVRQIIREGINQL